MSSPFGPHPRLIRPVDEFIEYHKSLGLINYCEVIIYPNGHVQYIIQSHERTLLRLYANKIKVPFYLVYDHISVDDYCMEWLLKQTGCITVTFYTVDYVDISIHQLDTVRKLQESEIIDLHDNYILNLLSTSRKGVT